jgi:hypothetical protein
MEVPLAAMAGARTGNDRPGRPIRSCPSPREHSPHRTPRLTAIEGWSLPSIPASTLPRPELPYGPLLPC